MPGPSGDHREHPLGNAEMVSTKHRPHSNWPAVPGLCHWFPLLGEKSGLRLRGFHRCARRSGWGRGALCCLMALLVTQSYS